MTIADPVTAVSPSNKGRPWVVRVHLCVTVFPHWLYHSHFPTHCHRMSVPHGLTTLNNWCPSYWSRVRFCGSAGCFTLVDLNLQRHSGITKRSIILPLAGLWGQGPDREWWQREGRRGWLHHNFGKEKREGMAGSVALLEREGSTKKGGIQKKAMKQRAWWRGERTGRQTHM